MMMMMMMIVNESKELFAKNIFPQVEEDFVPAPSLLLPLLGGSQEERTEELMKAKMVEMARTERMILKALNFHLRASTAATFLHYFTQVRLFVFPTDSLKVAQSRPKAMQCSMNCAFICCGNDNTFTKPS